jgi:hypothetical protein
MDGHWPPFLIVCGAAVCLIWLLLRDRPTDRSAIDIFAKQRGLRIISVTRSYNIFRYWFRGISVNNTARFYDVAVEDSEGNHGNVQIAFNSLFASGQVDVLDQQGLAPIPLDGSLGLAKPHSGMVSLSWTWHEGLALFGIGVGFSAFMFSGILRGILSSANRPVSPEPTLGYTYLLMAKHGNVYGTYFEYLVATYGIWTSLGFGAVCALFSYILKIQHKSRTYPRQIFAAAAISMVLYYAIWRVSIYVAPS